MEQLKKLYEQTLQSVEKDIQISSNRVIEFTHSILDLALQKIIEKISWKLLKQEQLDENRLPFLLDFCIEGAQRKFLILSAPYKIFEDLMETQTISTCEKLWDLLETRKTKLTSVCILYTE
jgi:hypothetical protein